MITLTMKLDQQLKALAGLRLPYDHRRESMRRFDPALAAGDVRVLVQMLRTVGIEASDAAKFDTLTAITFDRPPEPAGRRLDQDVSAYRRMISDEAFYAVAFQAAERAEAVERDLMIKEFGASCAKRRTTTSPCSGQHSNQPYRSSS